MSLSVKPGPRGSVLDSLRQSGSLRCLFPRPKSDGLEAVVVNTAGGITGGDSFQISAGVAQGCSLTLTTQASERAYRAQPSEYGQMRTDLKVAPGACLNWVPQETILFDRSALDRRLTVNLARGAKALVVEPVVFGRQAMGEELSNLRLRDRIEIRREGQPLFLDATRFDGNMAAHLDRPHIANGARAMALLAYVAPDAQGQIDPLRALLPETAGATGIGDDLLVLRILAPDSHALRQSLIPILNRLTQHQLPRCWMI
ncbi:urease accessory protein UreD [uncultured Aliiroseovarius sp.]|uniref:urease accessory protein UreD n=1 Tax=uncultured Aliiroseovarius sp. TaxID=1658783 RepID=UPI0026259271|nr:urease accessory protein UreD [uncultured Aliiroseovarius sp.]